MFCDNHDTTDCCEDCLMDDQYEIIKKLEDRVERLEEVVKAVAHVGVDFGYGPYELQPDDIDKARALLST